MKVALLLTGFIRNHHQCYESIKKKLLNVYDTDVYISTWDKTQSNLNSNIQNIDHSFLFNIYNVKSFKILDFDYYQSTKTEFIFNNRENDIFKTSERAKQHGQFWVERLIDQWFLVKEGFNLIKNNYDIIIRLRLDIKLTNFFIYNKNFTIPPSHILNPYNDHLAYGNYDEMKKYCTLYDNINILYNDYNVDISYAELMLKFYIEQTFPKITTNIDNSITYEILK